MGRGLFTEDEMNTNKISKGDEILTKYGIWYTVMKVVDNVVYVYGTNDTIHVSNVVKVAKSADDLEC